MKKIGIVGGVAWPSTITYYQRLNEEVGRRMNDGGHCAKLVLSQTDFKQVTYNQEIGNWEKVGELLGMQIQDLKKAGADFYIVACNTVHAAASYFETYSDLPYIHIVDAVADEILRQGFHTVGLMGSGYTMDKEFFKGRLKDKFGINVLIPEGEDHDNIHNALYEELVKGIILEETHEKFRTCVQHLIDRGAQTIILGCTEFQLIVKPEDSSVPLIDTVEAHVQAAVNEAMGE